MVLSSAISAIANDAVSVTVVTKGASRYILQDLGVEASDKPGIVTVLAVSKNVSIIKGRLTFDWWQRADATDDGTYGDRGFGDEHDFTLTGNWMVGPYAVEASAAYYMLAPLKGTDSDGVELYVDFGRPIELGHGISLTPAIRMIEFIGFKDFPDFTQIRYRMPITVSIPKLEGVKVVFDPSFNVAVTGGTTNDFVFRPTESVVWQTTEDLTFRLDVKHSGHAPVETNLGFVYHLF